MNELTRYSISVTRPLTDAFDHVKKMLFSPFDIGKWFAIGFSAWLAYLGSGGNLTFNFPSGQSDHSDGNNGSFNEIAGRMTDNLPLVISIAAVVIVVVLAISLVVLWLNSRGSFMFLNCVSKNTDKIVEPWKKYKPVANSYFFFMLILGIITFTLIAISAGIIIIAANMLGLGEPGANFMIFLPITIFISLIGCCIFVAMALVISFTKAFVVPVMYKTGLGCMGAWRLFWPLLTANKANFLLYVLFQIVIAISITIISCLAACITCCLVVLPYIGTVILLPLFVFKRSYSAFYLAQYGPDFDVFEYDIQPPVTDAGIIVETDI